MLKARLAAAARRPKLVTRLILVDATPSIDSVKARASTVSEVPVDGFPNHDALAAHVLLTHPEWSPTEIERIVAHDALTRDDGRVDWRHDRDAWTWAPDPGALWAALSSLPVPVDLIRASSGLVDASHTAEFLRHRPDARVHVVEAAHRVASDAPAELASIVNSLIG